MSVRALLLLLPWLLVLTGCLEIEQQFTINPNHTAKVRVRLTLDLALIRKVEVKAWLDMGNELAEAEDTLRSLAQQCIATATGVAAWTDYHMTKETDKLTVSMTAYVPDITAFQLNPEGSETPSMTFAMTSTSDGEERWEMIMPSVNDHPETPLPATLASDEVAEVLADRRRQLGEEAQDSKILFESLHIRSRLRFPRKVLAVTNATKISRQEAEVAFRGKRFYAMIEKILADEKLATQAFGRGAELHSNLALPGSQVNAWLFGKNAPVTITTQAGGRPLFDYKKELARAKTSPPPQPDKID